MDAPSLIACHECDLLQGRVALSAGGRARCVRCRAVLYRRPKASIDHAFAWALTAAVLLILANAFPIVGLEIEGRGTEATLIGASRALHDQGMTAVAALVLVTLVVFPTIQLTALLYLLAPFRAGRIAPGFASLFRLVDSLGTWQMFEVFMLGIIVSVVKLAHLATVIPGLGLWAFLALMFASIGATSAYDSQGVWARRDQILGQNRVGAGAKN